MWVLVFSFNLKVFLGLSLYPGRGTLDNSRHLVSQMCVETLQLLKMKALYPIEITQGAITRNLSHFLNFSIAGDSHAKTFWPFWVILTPVRKSSEYFYYMAQVEPAMLYNSEIIEKLFSLLWLARYWGRNIDILMESLLYFSKDFIYEILIFRYPVWIYFSR